ncbi:MAG: hypothetical protein GX536_06935 [Actinobacteria bacterium]|nr:hypothetical protein [Actinomycetota bacterium]
MRKDGLKRHGGFLVLMVALLAIGLLLMAGGCGKGSPAVTETTAASSAGVTSSTTPASAPGTSSTLVTPDTTTASGSTGGATGQVGATVTVSSTNGAYPKENAPDWSQIKSVGAYRSASYGVASLFVNLATDDVTAGSLSEYHGLPKPAPGEGRIKLVLTRTVADVNNPPLVTGKYDFTVSQGEAELTGEAGIVLPGGSTITFAKGADMESEVEITAISDTEVSGTFFVKDKWSEISGTFTAPVK